MGRAAYQAKMGNGLLMRTQAWCTAWIQAAPRLWVELPLALPSVTHAVQMALRPSRLARLAVTGMAGAIVLHSVELILSSHLLAAAMLLLVSAACGTWHRHARVLDAPRRLLVTADGTLHVITVGGALEAVTVHRVSMRLGRWLLLRLDGRKQVLYFVLGPDNVDPATLAALHRRLRGLAQPPGGPRC